MVDEEIPAPSVEGCGPAGEASVQFDPPVESTEQDAGLALVPHEGAGSLGISAYI